MFARSHADCLWRGTSSTSWRCRSDQPADIGGDDRLRARHWPRTGNGRQQRLDSQRAPYRAPTADAATQENDRSRSTANHDTLGRSRRVGRRNSSDRRFWCPACQQEADSMISKWWSGLRWRTSGSHPQQLVVQPVCCATITSVSFGRNGASVVNFRSWHEAMCKTILLHTERLPHQL